MEGPGSLKGAWPFCLRQGSNCIALANFVIPLPQLPNCFPTSRTSALKPEKHPQFKKNLYRKRSSGFGRDASAGK